MRHHQVPNYRLESLGVGSYRFRVDGGDDHADVGNLGRIASIPADDPLYRLAVNMGGYLYDLVEVEAGEGRDRCVDSGPVHRREFYRIDRSTARGAVF